MNFREYDGINNMKIIRPYNAMVYDPNVLYRSRLSQPVEMKEFMHLKHRQVEADLFSGGQAYTCSAPMEWNQPPPPTLSELAALVEKYRRPRLYVRSLQSEALEKFMSLLPPVLAEHLDVRESAILLRPPVRPTLFGHLAPGVYGCGRDYYLVE